ncbi:MAG: hypothetical protein FJ397_01665, partial [Verrucomicrobia bacterium]|nr:hypothetical protein [Verrucomicrobiota bacterium]
MPPSFRRVSSVLAGLAALAAAPVALGTPSISSLTPASGSISGVVSTPSGQPITVTATPTAGASIVSVVVSVNGSSLGNATLTAPSTYSLPWFPSVAGTYTISATVTDNSNNTAASPNNLTASSTITIPAARSAQVLAPSNNGSLVLNSKVFLRASAAMSDGVVQRVDYLLDPGTPGERLLTSANQSPFNAAYTVSGVAVGTHVLIARATASDGVTTFDSPPVNINVVSAVGSPPVPSLTSPAAGAYVATSTAITLAATASDPDGFIPSTPGGGLTFFADGDPIGTDLTAPYTVSWTPTVAKSYSLVVQAVDDRGNTGQSAPLIVNAVASLPTVTLSAPTTATLAAATTLSATASGSAGESVATVRFLVNGVPVSGLLGTAPFTASWTPAALGSASVTAQVTDTAGITVTSLPANVVVSAASGSAVSLLAPANGTSLAQGAQVFLRSTAAIAGNIISRVDYYLDGAPLPGASVGQAPYNFAYTVSAAPGVHTLFARAVASDGATSVDSAAVSFTVVPAVGFPPAVELTSPAPASFVLVGSPVPLAAVASDADGFISPNAGGGVTFYADGDPVGSDLLAPYASSWTPTVAKLYSLRAQTVDDKGNLVLSAPIAVTALAALPTVALVSPPTSASQGVPVQLTAAANASPGASVARVLFFANGVQIGSPALTVPYSVSWVPGASGPTALTVQVIDSLGAAITSAPISVTVASTSAPVVLTAPGTGAVVPVGTPIDVTATAAAPTAGASVAQVQFLAGTTVIGTVNTAVAGAYRIKWAPTAGNSTLTARVTDTLGGTATSAPVVVTGVAATTVALTAPAANANATVGTALNLAATAAATLGAVITQVEFLAGSVPVGIATTAPFTFAWTPTVAGPVSLTARATDSFGTVVASTPVSINVVNSAPAATITSPVPGNLLNAGTPVTITAAVVLGSSGAPVTRVQFLAGSSVVATVAGDPSLASYSATWTPASAGDFNLSVRITDANGAVATSPVVNVTVVTVSTQIVITSPSPGGAQVGTPIVISATVDAAPGVSITQVQFLAGSTVVATVPGSANATSYSATWTPTVAGSYNLTVRTTDSNGAVRNSAAVQIVAQATTVALSLLPAGTSIPVNSSRMISATASAPAGVASVEFFYVGSGGVSLIGKDTAPPYNVLFTAPDEPGPRFLRARATDILGQSVDSADFAISITGQIGVAPTLGILTPVSGSFVAANNTATISGTATDADGSITSVQVFVNGTTAGLAGAGVTGVTNGVWSVNWTPTSSGVASISAIATDNAGNAVAAPAVGVNISDSTSPSISLSLSPRTAAAAASTTLPSGAVRTLVADVTPSSGRAVVRVEFFIDGTKVAEDTSAPYTYRYTAPPLAAGDQSQPYVISARATDNAGTARDTQISMLVISPAGGPPTVNLLTPANGASTTPGSAISLAATATSIDSTIASVQFYVNGSPAPVNGGNGITAAPYVTTFVPTLPGSYVIDAIATDARGNTAISGSVTVSAALPIPTIVFTAPNPNATARATPGVPLTLAATPSVLGGGAQFLLVEFLLDGVQIGADTTAPYTFSWIPTAAQLGERVLTARVTDLNAQVVTSAPITVNVANVVGSPPTVTVSATPIPGNGLQTASTVNFQALAVATGTGSTLRNVEIFLNDISIGLATREQTTNFYRRAFDLSQFDFSTITPTINENTGAVTYPVRLYAIARDSNNNQTVSPTVNLTIFPATSAPPTIQVQALTPTNITAGTQFFMQANLNDPDGNVSTVQLYANGSLVGNFPNPQQGQLLTYTANTAGRFNLYAVATDETGNTAVSTPSIVINVTAVTAPTTAITRPSDNSTATTVGSPVFLEGTAVNAVTTQVPTLQFIATAAGGARQVISGTRVGTTTSYRAIWTPTNPDTYTITTQASVGNVQGTSTTSRRVVVSDVVGLAPTISLTRSPGVLGYPTSAQTASSADFAATAQDPDGAVVAVEFFLNRFSIGQARRDPQGNTWRLQASFAGLQPGATEIVALARDSSGNVVPSATGSINVTAAASIA